MNRERHLARLAPHGWVPARGDQVVIPIVPKTLAANVMSGTVWLIAPPYAKVLVRYGARMHRFFVFKIQELRPV